MWGMPYNGWVYEKLGITERYTVKPHKVKCELHTSNLALTAQFFIYRVCALHEQSTPTESSRKNLKIQIFP